MAVSEGQPERRGKVNLQVWFAESDLRLHDLQRGKNKFLNFFQNGRIIKSLEAVMPIKHRWPYQGEASSIFDSGPNRNIHTQTMTKSLEVISEAVRNPKHPFRKVDNQPKKPQKHRYERRKIKEYLHLGDWMATEAT